jgi:hypothetical protein
MRRSEFIRLTDIEEESDMDNLDIGDRFLYGRNVINQKQEKEIGDSITYYEVIDKKHGSVEYTPIFDYMEKDYENEKENKI